MPKRQLLSHGGRKERSLYDCMEARYPSDGSRYIYCRKGYRLCRTGVHVSRFNFGWPLVYKACQDCPDFNEDA